MYNWMTLPFRVVFKIRPYAKNDLITWPLTQNRATPFTDICSVVVAETMFFSCTYKRERANSGVNVSGHVGKRDSECGLRSLAHSNTRWRGEVTHWSFKTRSAAWFSLYILFVKGNFIWFLVHASPSMAEGPTSSERASKFKFSPKSQPKFVWFVELNNIHSYVHVL